MASCEWYQLSSSLIYDYCSSDVVRIIYLYYSCYQFLCWTELVYKLIWKMGLSAISTNFKDSLCYLLLFFLIKNSNPITQSNPTRFRSGWFWFLLNVKFSRTNSSLINWVGSFYPQTWPYTPLLLDVEAWIRPCPWMLNNIKYRHRDTTTFEIIRHNNTNIKN